VGFHADACPCPTAFPVPRPVLAPQAGRCKAAGGPAIAPAPVDIHHFVATSPLQ